MFTIGYEKKDLDELYKILRRNGVKIVVDVRANPFSYKRGFSKKPLKEFLERHKLEYYNIPELGTTMEERDLFKRKTTIPQGSDKYKKRVIKQTDKILAIRDLEKRGKTVLLCFEKDWRDCHRRVLAETFFNEVTHL